MSRSTKKSLIWMASWARSRAKLRLWIEPIGKSLRLKTFIWVNRLSPVLPALHKRRGSSFFHKSISLLSQHTLAQHFPAR